MMKEGQTWLCCNEDGQYMVFRLHEGEYLDYQEKNGNYMWEKIIYDKNSVITTIRNGGVPVRESNFATNLHGLEPGEKIMLKD